MLRFSIFILLGFLSVSCSNQQPFNEKLAWLGISVSPQENREFSFTDKQSAYFYGRTHSIGQEWFSGWNVATEKIFSDYHLVLNGEFVDRKNAAVTVYPNVLIRKYSWGTESFQLFDNRKVLEIELPSSEKLNYGLVLLSEEFQFQRVAEGTAFYTKKSNKNLVLAVSSVQRTELSFSKTNTDIIISSGNNQTGFFIALDSTESAVNILLDQAATNHQTWTANRYQRMCKLLDSSFLKTEDTTHNKAVAWNILSADALITEQSGQGIYAGLPWFNDYWGRDMFISLTGVTLVTGEFSVARNILLSFATYQNTDTHSPFYGRIPNRVRPDEIIYNTTDGTPRFIHALYDYVRYSGDTTLIQKLYPVIQRSINGPLQHWVDEKGYLTHDDADTWMDAKWDGKTPWSPRGNRAVDIQSLWYDQLSAGIYFAKFMENRSDEKKWSAIQIKLKNNFNHDFVDSVSILMSDRLTKANKPDFTVRPNQLFAYNLLDNDSLKYKLTKYVWENLVYPWGVASLSQLDENFHPWHQNDTYIHKDEAYHNGTVWLWNNGIAMQRMIEAGQKNIAFELFSNMSRQTLHSQGAVGALSELTDALPRNGKSTPDLSGAFSQAWSSAEYLRVWYQDFLGIQPNAIDKSVSIKPNIPNSLHDIDYKIKLYDGNLIGSFHRSDSLSRFAFVVDSTHSEITLVFQFDGYGDIVRPAISGTNFSIVLRKDGLELKIIGKDNKIIEQTSLHPNGELLEKINQRNHIMKGVHFTKPFLNPNLEVLKPNHKEQIQKWLDKQMKMYR